MKTKGLLFLIILIILAILYKFCWQKTVPIVEIKSQIKSPIAISFIELNSSILKNVDQKIKVTFIDPGGKVMSSNGIPLSTIDVTSVMSIGLAPDADFSPEKPYVFYIKAESEGYATNIRPVVVTADVSNYIPFYLVKLVGADPVAGLSTAVGGFSNLAGSVLQANDTIDAGPADRPLRLVLPEGLSFLANGKPIKIKGKLNFSMLNGSPMDSMANRAFPGGFEVVNAVNADGARIATPTEPNFFTTAGWFSLDIKDTEGQRVDGFSKPVSVEMPIDNKIVNPLTNAPVKAGDEIPIWSMDEQTGVWMKEGQVSILDAGSGQLTSRFEIMHLSTWNLDFNTTGCAFGTEDITVSYTNAEFPGNDYYSEYQRESDGAIFPTQLNLSTGSPLIIIRTLTGGRLFVHEGPNEQTRLRGRTGVLTCGGTGTLGLLGSTSFPCVEYTLNFTPAGSIVPLCNVPVWYKEGTCGGAGYLYNAGSPSELTPGVVQVFSTGDIASSECLQMRFTNALDQEVILPFEISYALVGNGVQTVNNASATIAGVVGAATFNYTYEVTNGTTCGKNVQIVIGPTGITGLTACD